MTEQELAYIQKIISEATPGPWGPYMANTPFYAVVTKPAPSLSKHDDWPIYWRIEDAMFVAMARDKMPILVAEIKRLREEIKKLEAENSRLRKAVQLALELEQNGLVDFTKYQLTHSKDIERLYIAALEEK